MTKFLSLLLATPDILGTADLKQLLLIIAGITIMISIMYVLSTSGSYQPIHESKWVARWSQKGDTRAILIINILFIVISIVNIPLKIVPTEPLQLGIAFVVVFFCSLSIKAVRYFTDIKKDRPSVY